MENKNIIMIFIVVIVILAVVIGVMLLNPASSKEATKIKITSDKEQYEGGNLSVKLTDLNNTPISKEIVNITIADNKGKVVVDDVVKTDSKGKAKIDLDLKKGKYSVNVTYGGNENYTGNNTTQKLTIKEEVQQATPSSSSTTYDGRDLSGGSGESVEVTGVHEDSGVVEGYKCGRKGVWTPSGNLIEEGGGY